MSEHIIYKGILTIDKQILKIENRDIYITKIDSLEITKLDRYPLFKGMKLWLKGLFILIVLSIIYHGNSWISLIGDLYCYSIFLLVVFNLYQHCKLFYGLVITTAGNRTIIASTRKDFICRVRDRLQEAIENTINERIVINLDNCLVNHGNISYGSNNKNEVKL